MDEYDYLLVLIFLSAFAGAAFNIALVIQLREFYAEFLHRCDDQVLSMSSAFSGCLIRNSLIGFGLQGKKI